MTPSWSHNFDPDLGIRRYSSRSRGSHATVTGAMLVTPAPQRPRTSAFRNRQNTLRQIYGARCEITLLGEDHYLSYSTRAVTSPNLLFGSTNTSTGPYSNDILYGGDVEKGSSEFRLSQASLVDVDRVKGSKRERGELKEQRRALYSRDSLSSSIDRGGFDKDDRPNPSISSLAKVNQFKPNGLRNNLLSKGRGGQDELVAMGTLWSPNVHAKPLRTLSVCTNGNATASTSTPRRVASVNVPSGACRQNPNPSNSQLPSKSLTNGLDPKYGDPLLGAPPQYQQRLAELSTLESDTVRYERTRKLKKKQPKQDRDS